MEAAARPVRKPPSSCLRDCVAPCMRRFSSLMSKLPVGMTLSPPDSCSSRPTALHGSALRRPSASDDGAAAGAAQNCADRAWLRDRKHDDRQRSFPGKRECGSVHDLIVAFDGLGMAEAVKSPGGRVFFGIGAVDAIDIGRL